MDLIFLSCNISPRYSRPVTYFYRTISSGTRNINMSLFQENNWKCLDDRLHQCKCSSVRSRVILAYYFTFTQSGRVFVFNISYFFISSLFLIYLGINIYNCIIVFIAFSILVAILVYYRVWENVFSFCLGT